MAVLFSGNCRSVRDPKLLARFLRGHFRGRHLSPARHLVTGTSNLLRVLQVCPNLMRNSSLGWSAKVSCVCVCFYFPSNSVNFMKTKAQAVRVKCAFSLKREKCFFSFSFFLWNLFNLLQILKKMQPNFFIYTHSSWWERYSSHKSCTKELNHNSLLENFKNHYRFQDRIQRWIPLRSVWADRLRLHRNPFWFRWVLSMCLWPHAI